MSEQKTLFEIFDTSREEIKIKFTRNVEYEQKEKIKKLFEEVIPYFPEFKRSTFKVGYTESGACYVPKYIRKTDREHIYIRLSEHDITRYVLAHELTHELQYTNNDIPQGEKQCDIWTLARSTFLLDHPPHYLEVPKSVRENWYDWKEILHQVAEEAIQKREEGLFRYIRYFEDKVKELEEEYTYIGKKDEY